MLQTDQRPCTSRAFLGCLAPAPASAAAQRMPLSPCPTIDPFWLRSLAIAAAQQAVARGARMRISRMSTLRALLPKTNSSVVDEFEDTISFSDFIFSGLNAHVIGLEQTFV